MLIIIYLFFFFISHLITEEQKKNFCTEAVFTLLSLCVFSPSADKQKQNRQLGLLALLIEIMIAVSTS